MKRFRIAHVIPQMNPAGGIEVAIAKSLKDLNIDFDYQVFYAKKRGGVDLGQRSIWRLFSEILWVRSKRPNLIVTSLWWAHPVGILAQSLGLKWAAFFHCAGYAHPVDRILQRLSWKKARFALVDSRATGLYMTQWGERHWEVIPYFFPSIEGTKDWAHRSIDLVWAARLSPQKRIDTLIAFLKLSEKKLGRRKVVIVTSGGTDEDLNRLVAESGHDIRLESSLANEALLTIFRDSKFYLQFSDMEGMSMTTLEAMTSGCVAVVRRVGEMLEYLEPQNCVEVMSDQPDDLESVLERILALSQNPAAAAALVHRSQQAAARLPGYTESFRQVMGRLAAIP